MSDDLDDLLRRAMKTLDDQVPSGYFEGLPEQTLARLEGSMQNQVSGTDREGQPDTIPVAREEDSGLHDIRSLASSTKARLSSKRSTQSPVIADDVVAQTSGAWKHVALPEPAKMVSLPSLDELPSADEVLANERLAERMKDAEGAAAPGASPAVAAFSAWAKPKKKSKAGVIAVVSVGLAAAAGVFLFVQTQSKDNAAKTSTVSEHNEANGAAQSMPVREQQFATPPAAAPAVTPPDEAKPTEIAVTGAVDTTTAQDGAGGAKQAEKKAPSKTTTQKGKGEGKVDKTEPKDKPPVETKPNPKVETKTDPKKDGKTDKKKDGEPSLEDLLNEAGDKKPKEKEKPALEKKSLTGDDFKKGMAAIGGKAKGCYKGTQGMAQLKVAIAPSGQISKVTLTGQFAGTPEGNCVEAAVKSASFPPWDGNPASFGWTILLSE